MTYALSISLKYISAGYNILYFLVRPLIVPVMDKIKHPGFKDVGFVEGFFFR